MARLRLLSRPAAWIEARAEETSWFFQGTVLAMGFAGIFLCTVYLVLKVFTGGTVSVFETELFAFLVGPILERAGTLLSGPALPLVLGISFLLYLLFPARRDEKFFSHHLLQDTIWYGYQGVIQYVLLVTYVVLLHEIHGRYFSYLTLGFFKDMPLWAVVVVSFLLYDFLAFAAHYVTHKSKTLWQFHAVHHSQRELNAFASFRYHTVDYVVQHTFVVIPFIILGFDESVIAGALMVRHWFSQICHTNIRLNFGPLKHVLVTPQSHRIHHGVADKYQDMNFGFAFTIWDHLFGTQYKDYEDYPATGIADSDFPDDVARYPHEFLLAPVVQHLYPLKVLFEKMRTHGIGSNQTSRLGAGSKPGP